MDINISDLMEYLAAEAKKRTVRNEKLKPFFGKISFSFQDGKMVYVERNETIK